MSRWAGVALRPRLTVWSKLHITFILQWIDFIFGRNEEEDQFLFHMQDRQLSLPLLLKKKKKNVHNAIGHFSCGSIIRLNRQLYILKTLDKKK